MDQDRGDDEIEALLQNLDPTESPAVQGADLRRIAALVAGRERLEHDLRDAVRLAHAHGESWAEIAVALGVSRRAARRMYAARSPDVG